MSEKRFEITEYGSDYYIEIIDNEKELDESIDNPSQKLGLVECADLLNELSEENGKLNQLLNEAEDLIESRLSEHFAKQYENIKHNIIGDD